jgi:hypothetical protein
MEPRLKAREHTGGTLISWVDVNINPLMVELERVQVGESLEYPEVHI